MNEPKFLAMEASGDDYEESFESFSSKSPIKSPQKQHQQADGGDGPDRHDDKDKVAGMNLETFMGNYKIDINGKKDGVGGAEEDPSMRPLEGVSPDRERFIEQYTRSLVLQEKAKDSNNDKEPRITSPVDTSVEKKTNAILLGV